MTWWGKILGGTFGFMMGGPLGAILGAAVGNYFDNGVDGIRYDNSLGLGNTERVQSVFFTSIFSVMGYVAKSDGVVSKTEIHVAEQLMGQMRLQPEQRKVAIKLFSQGKAGDFPIHEVLEQFRRECFRRRHLILMFMEVITATALVDGNLHSKERKVLESIAGDLGFSTRDFQAFLQRMQGRVNFNAGPSATDRLRAAHETLGINKSTSDDELKKAYRRLMAQNHPDKLVAKGLPEEMITVATAKTQEIKAAYDLIRENRKN